MWQRRRIRSSSRSIAVTVTGALILGVAATAPGAGPAGAEPDPCATEERVVSSVTVDTASRIVQWMADGSGEATVPVDGLEPIRLAVSPSGDMLAFTAIDDRSATGTTGQPDLFVAPLDGSASPLRLTEGGTAGQPWWSPDGTRIAVSLATPADLGRVLVLDASGVAAPTVVSGDLTGTRTPVWSADGTGIAFTRQLPGVAEVWLAPADGSTPPAQFAADLTGVPQQWALSGDGTMATVVMDGTSAYVGPTDGSSTPVALTTGDPAAPISGSLHLTWSPDGLAVAVSAVAGDTATLFVGDPSTPLPPVDSTTPAASAGSPAWSPDGTHVAWVVDESLRSATADASAPAVEVASGADDRRTPAWSADSVLLAWLVDPHRPNGFPAEAAVAPADASAPATVVSTSRWAKTELGFSSGGTVVAATSPAADATPAEQVVSISPGGSDRTVLATAPAIDPVVSPDGEWVAVVAAGPGGTSVQALPVDGGSPIDLGPGSDDTTVAWSPDSIHLAIVDPDGQLTVAEVGGDTPAEEITGPDDPAVLDAAWSPDGSTLAWWSATDEGAAILGAAADGSGDPQTLRAYVGAIAIDQLSWSADATRLAAVVIDAGVDPVTWTVEVFDGATGDLLDQGPGGNDGVEMAWAPAGDWLAVASLSADTIGAFDGTWSSTLQVWETDDGGRIDLGTGRAPAWSPDGSHLAFDTRNSQVSGGQLTVVEGEIVVVDPLDPGTPTTFGVDAHVIDAGLGIGLRSVDSEPEWSPDGADLAWVRTYRADPSVGALGLFALFGTPGFFDVMRAPTIGGSPARVMTTGGFTQTTWAPTSGSLLSYERTTGPAPATAVRYTGSDHVSSTPAWGRPGCAADLSVSIAGLDNGDRLSAGSTGAALVVVTNGGPGASKPASVAVDWPDRLGVTTPSPDVGTFDAGLWTLPALEPGATATLTLPFGVIADSADAGGTVGQLIAQLTGGGDDPDLPDRTASVTFSLQGTSGYNPVTPTRILDTRKGIGAPEAPLGAGGAVVLDVNGLGGVPDEGVTAVVLNLTGTGSSTATHLTVHPADTPRPTASNLNLATGQTAANLVVVPVAPDGSIRIVNNAGSAHAIADVVGWFDDGYAGGFGLEPTAPVRVLDTRKGEGAPLAKVGPGETLVIRPPQLFDAGTGDATAAAAVLTLTGVAPTAATHISAWGDGDRPMVSSLNLPLNATRSNLVVVPVGADGSIRLRNNSGDVDLVADLAGSFPLDGSGLPFHPVDPVRLLDTRSGVGTTGGAFGPREQRDLPVASRPEVGDDAKVAILNFTAVAPLSDTHLRVWPAGTTRPLTAVLNAPVAQTTPSLAFSTLGPAPAGAVSLYNNSGRSHYLADLSGWFG